MNLIGDTSPEAELVLIRAFRAMTPSRKWAILGDLYRMGRDIHEAGLRSKKPGATPIEARNDWISAQIGNFSWNTPQGLIP